MDTVDQLCDQLNTINLTTPTLCTVCQATVEKRLKKAMWFRIKRFVHMLRYHNSRLGEIGSIVQYPLHHIYSGDCYRTIGTLNHIYLTKMIYKSYIERNPFLCINGIDVTIQELILNPDSRYLPVIFKPIVITINSCTNERCICTEHSCPTCTGIKSHRKVNCWKCEKYNKLNNTNNMLE